MTRPFFRRRLGCVVCAVALGFLAANARADRIETTDGKKIEGAILKESDSALWIDLGFTVIEVPKNKVATRSTEGVVQTSSGSETETGIDLWTEKALPEIDVEKALVEFGEGVVMVKVPGALGSGFIIREDGYIVTNAHVVQGEIEVSVTVYQRVEGRLERKTYERVQIIALNPFVDLALLKIDPKELGDRKLKKVYFGRIDEVKQGSSVFAVGAPRGLDFTQTQGSVSSTNRAMDGKVYIQIDAPINPGNSGGPLFNSKGEVIGVNSLKLGASEGLNFAIPIDYVKHFVVNRDAFAFDRDNPNSGHRYLEPPKKQPPKLDTKEDSP